ncbi:MAG: hypothetical protein ACTTH7_05845 [Treponema sp.]
MSGTDLIDENEDCTIMLHKNDDIPKIGYFWDITMRHANNKFENTKTVYKASAKNCITEAFL